MHPLPKAFRRAESPSRSARPGRQQGPRASRRASCRWSCGAPRCERGGTAASWGRRTAGCLAQLGLGRSRGSGHGHGAGCRSRHDAKPAAALLVPASHGAASNRACCLRWPGASWAACAARHAPPSPVVAYQCRSISSQKCVRCPGHAGPFEQQPTGAETSMPRALSNAVVLHGSFAAALLPSDTTQGQSYNSHSCSTAPCRRAFVPRARHRECSHHTQPARHSRDLKSQIASQQD